MTIDPPNPFAFPGAAAGDRRRLAGVAAVILVHAVLFFGWQTNRPMPPVQPDGPRFTIAWIRLPAVAPPTNPAPAAPLAPARAPAVRHTAPAVAPEASHPSPAPAPEAVFTTPVPAAPSAGTILERARSSAGAVDRALRQENRPYIVAPPDSPQIRMRSSMDKAHALAPSRLWEAPKVEELVNQTGDGARRTRVVGGLITYCITERSTATSPEMIAMHGKIRLTNCPQHEDTATQQDWRTARD